MSSSDTKMKKTDLPTVSDRLLKILIVLAVLVALPDILSLFGILYEMHPYTTLEEIPAFYGLYALVAFLTLLAIAKFLQPILRREENYYD
ncbi:hypothetical protein [Sneathiella glossodoripedis]|uniref:hypothetical protein n=1 Tax=Sneathiella glossodoripedis TaxID=418853 RepID=UPI00047212FA|nr:hypothetical protein [Sneathiella glossodoripedis]